MVADVNGVGCCPGAGNFYGGGTLEQASVVEADLTDGQILTSGTVQMVGGLGARTVGNIRGRLEVDMDADIARARTGRDGRVRPLDNAEGRLRASAIIKEKPNASLREVAREAGISPSTVRDVRQRVTQG